MEENHKFAAVTASCMCLLQAMRHFLRGASSAKQQHTGHISVCCPVTAGVVRACGCRGDFGWDHFPLASVHPSSSAENTAVMHICSHDKTSLPAASHGERENAKMSQVISLTTSAVLMLSVWIFWKSAVGEKEGRNRLAVFTQIQVSHQGCPASSGTSPSCMSTMRIFTAPGRTPQHICSANEHWHKGLALADEHWCVVFCSHSSWW